MAGLAGISEAVRGRAAEAGKQLEGKLQAAFGTAASGGTPDGSDPAADDEHDPDGAAAALARRVAAALGGGNGGGAGCADVAALRQLQEEARRLVG